MNFAVMFFTTLVFTASLAMAQTSTTTPITPAPSAGATPAPGKILPAKAKKILKLPPAPVPEEKTHETETKSDSLENVFDQLDYPELQVVPRATERLLFEAQNESEMAWVSHWPLQVSALATLGLGITANGKYQSGASDENKKSLDTASTTAIGIGAFWIGTSAFYALTKPYATGYNRVKKIKATDKRGELTRERVAEEAMEAPAKTIASLTRLAMISNVFAAMYVGSYTDSGTKRVAFVSALLALTPLVFEDRYVETWEKHLEYKRKIYTPISAMGFGVDKNSKLFPQMTLRWEF